MMELFIEDKKVDIHKQDASLLTYALDDVKDFASRNTSFSKTIILPGTANNNSIFGNVFNVTISNAYNSTDKNVGTNFNASVGAKCIMFQNRLQVFKGTLRLLEITIDKGHIEYQVAVFGELGGLILKLGNKKLEDLDFSAYNHVWNAANIVASWDATPGTGYVYPLIDYGTVSTGKVNYDVKAFRPALFVREYLNKMITNAGYTWLSDLFDTARFKKLIIPNNRDKLEKLTSNLVAAARAANYTIITTAAPDAAYQFVTFAGTGWTANANKDRFTYTDAAPLNVNMAFDLSGLYSNNLMGITISLKKNGTTIQTWTDGLDDTATDPPPTVPWQRAALVNISVVTNDYLEIWFTASGGTSVQMDSDIGDLTISTVNPVLATLAYGGDIVINDTIPKNILQVDFFASILKLFNLYVYEDSLYAKKILIAPYVDFYDLNASGVLDWTYKIDRSKPLSIKPMSELNSRLYNFTFKDDTDFYNDAYKKKYNETFGAYKYDSLFEFSTAKTDIPLIFSPSPLVGYAGVDKMVTAIYKKKGTTVGTDEEMIGSNIRILQFKKVIDVTSWDITGVSGVLNTGTVYGYGGNYDDPDVPANDIHFGVPAELFFVLAAGAINVTQFNVYWSSYMAEITDKDSKLLRCTAKLNNADIFNLNYVDEATKYPGFAKLIYVDGSYWRLNKIEDWNANEPDTCKIELLKVIATVY